MREIKFELIYKEGENTGSEVVTLDEFIAGEFMGTHHNLIAKRQFTGLHDKNGKEIYEGDIVSVPYVNPMGCVEPDTVDYISVITYQNGGFVIDSCELKVEKISIAHSLEKSPGRYVSNYGNVTEYGRCLLKIIGNIHENPELLNTENA